MKHRLSAWARGVPLLRTLLDLRGNERACVYTEPIYGIPFYLYMPFVSLYMYALGMNDARIGLLVSIGMVMQVFWVLIGGVVVDKMGRKRSTLVFDFISWSIPTALWALAQNFWWFFAAAIFNSLWYITSVSWNLLMTEDAPPRSLVGIYTLVTAAGLLSVFFAPLSGLMVRQFTLVPVMRVLYALACAMFTFKFFYLNRISIETRRGEQRMRQTQGLSLWTMLRGYGSVLRKMLKTPQTMAALAVMTLVNITETITGTFFSLYATKNLLLPEQFIAYFPIVRAAVMLVFLFAVQRTMSGQRLRGPMLLGVAFYLCGQTALLLARPGGYALLLVQVFCEAFGFALIMPRKDTMRMAFVDAHERARVVSLMFVFMIALSSPFGYIAGQLSTLDRRLPFVLNMTLYAACALVLLLSRALSHPLPEAAQEVEEDAPGEIAQ